MILLRISRVLELLSISFILIAMFEEYSSVEEEHKGAVAWGIIFGFAWFLYMIYKIVL